MSMAREDDGSYVLYHKNKKIEAEMDRKYVRWPGEMRWSPRRSECKYSTMCGFHTSELAALIGKGPSLDNLTKENLKPYKIIICCNDSVHRVISLCPKANIYSVQLDNELRDTCVTQHAQHFISAWAKDWAPNATVLPTAWNKKLLTAVEAIALGKHLGVVEFGLFGFDAMKGKLGYAKCIGYTPGKNAERFLKHKELIINALGGTKYEVK